MTSTPLGYGTPEEPRSRWRWWLAGIAGVLLVASAAPVVTLRQVESQIDPVTGTLSWRTAWRFGITSGPRIDASPLEARLNRAGISWTRSWQLLHNTYRNIFGGVTRFECGSAPPIYQLRPVMKAFAAAASDADLREFVRVMQSGTAAEQKVAVDAAAEKGLRAPDGETTVPAIRE